MRIQSLLSSLLVSVSLPALASGMPQDNLRMADWHVAPMMANNDSEPSYCAMATHYDTGPVITYTRNLHGKGSIAIDFPNAELERGRQYGVTLSFAGEDHPYTAKAISKTQLVLQMGENKTLNNTLDSGEAITVSLDGTSGQYQLAGNMQAFFELQHCVKGLIPAAPQATTQTAEATMATSDSAPGFASVMPVVETPRIQQEDITAPAAPVAMAAPQAVPQPVIAPTHVANIEPVASPTAPILWDANQSVQNNPPAEQKTDKTSVTTLADTNPAAGEETSTEDLKSTLAKARAEANDEMAVPVAQPKAAPAPVAAPIIASPQKIVDAPPAKPVETKPLAPKQPVLAATPPAPVVKTEMKNIIPIAAPKTAADQNEMKGLLFDNTNPVSTNPKAQEIATPTPKTVVTKTTTVSQTTIEKPPVTMPAIVKTPVEPDEPLVMPVFDQKPVAPAIPAPVAAKPVISKAPVQNDVIQDIPPAMPQPIKSTIAVSAEPVMTQQPVANRLNTVTPSVGAPLKPVAPAFVASAPSMPAAMPTPVRNAKPFVPAPATAKGQWKTRVVSGTNGGKDDDFCLMENGFGNDTTLMVSQRNDGYSTLGVNYGVDMLQPNKNYNVNVRVDNAFEEDFTGYAESEHTLVVQLGKKASFFSTLANADALRVAIPGTASSFSLQNLPADLNEFSQCIVGLGGAPIFATAPVALANNNAPIVTNAPVASMVLDSPATMAVSTTTTSSMTTTSSASWTDHIRQALDHSDLAVAPQFTADTAHWSNGALQAQAQSYGAKDVIDAASTALDSAETSCAGQFTAQMGLPDSFGDQTLQPMESKCALPNGQMTITTWLAQRDNTATTVWSFAAPREEKSKAFQLRDKIMNIFQGKIDTASTSISDKQS